MDRSLPSPWGSMRAPEPPLRREPSSWRPSPGARPWWRQTLDSADRLRTGAPVDLTGTQSLTERLKRDLRSGFAHGDRPTVAGMLGAYPGLQSDRDGVLSLLYEEFCLLEEAGEPVDVADFCGRYPAWRDSLQAQLGWHALLSQTCLRTQARTPVRYPEPGTWFTPQFRLCAVLGRGGAAQVYLAEQPEFERLVVLKILRDEGREHVIQGRLDHDHIVPVWSIVRDEATGLRGQIMPYRPGLPLDQVLDRLEPRGRTRTARAVLEQLLPADRLAPGVPLPAGWAGFPLAGSYADAVAWIGLILARALAYAHAQGVVHRDVKPANILLGQEDGPLLLDFNLAHLHDPADEAAAARSGGTLPYMAPEQLAAFLEPQRWSDVGPGADLFALGLVLQELLTGHRPEAPDERLSQGRAIQQMLELRRLEPVPTRSGSRRVPRTLDAILGRCLRPQAADRYPDAHALAEDLLRYLDRRPLRHARVRAPREQLAHFLSRHRTRLTMATLGMVVGLAGVGGLLASPENRRQLALRIMGPRITAESLVQAARTAFDRLDNTQAREWLEQALQIEPDSHDALHLLGVIHTRDQPDYERAYQLYSRALTLMPPVPPIPKDGRNPSNLRVLYQREVRAVRLLDRVRAVGGLLNDPAILQRPAFFDRLVTALADLDEAESLRPPGGFVNHNVDGQIARERTIVWSGLNNYAYERHDDLGNLAYLLQVVRAAREGVELRPTDRVLLRLRADAEAMLTSWHPCLVDFPPDRPDAP